MEIMFCLCFDELERNYCHAILTLGTRTNLESLNTENILLIASNSEVAASVLQLFCCKIFYSHGFLDFNEKSH